MWLGLGLGPWLRGRLLRRRALLAPPHGGVAAGAGQQFVMAAAFDDAALFEHQNQGEAIKLDVKRENLDILKLLPCINFTLPDHPGVLARVSIKLIFGCSASWLTAIRIPGRQ